MCNFSKSIGGGGGQRVKSAQGTIKVMLKSDFSSDLIHFLAIIGGGGGLPKRYKATPSADSVLQCFFRTTRTYRVIFLQGKK